MAWAGHGAILALTSIDDRGSRIKERGMNEDEPHIPLFESLPPTDRARAASAAAQFLLRHDWASLQEAVIERGGSLKDLWEEIMAQAGLPPCTVPVFAMIC